VKLNIGFTGNRGQERFQLIELKRHGSLAKNDMVRVASQVNQGSRDSKPLVTRPDLVKEYVGGTHGGD
jgi:hypothetical protein